MLKILAILCISLSVSCAHQANKSRSGSTKKLKRYSKEIKRLEKNLNKQALIVKQLRDQNERLRLGSVGSQQKARRNRASESGTEKSFAQDIGESKLFGTFLSAHNSKRRKKAARAFYLLEKTFPNSPLLAEAIYLQGKTFLETKYYKAALRKMNRLIEEFPTHSRSRSGMLAKSVIYRRLNLMGPSRSVLQDLIKKYPKTSEARKAKSHLALLESAEKTETK